MHLRVLRYDITNLDFLSVNAHKTAHVFFSPDEFFKGGMRNNTGKTSIFVSPFILPYLQADAQDLEVLASTALEGSPSETLLHSPMEEPGQKMSKSEAHGLRLSVSTERRESNIYPPLESFQEASSPSPPNRSVIEASISELLFDPDLTFLDSPGIPSPDRRSASKGDRSKEATIHDSSLPSFGINAAPVSPDRSIVPLDESEIVFTEELRGSSKSKKILKEEQADGNVRVKRQRLKKDEAGSESSVLDLLETRVFSGKPVAGQRKVVSSALQVRKKGEEAIEEQQATPQSIRKSPRFASKVLVHKQTSDHYPIIHLCPVCRKAYKRVRDFEKHVAGCGR